MGEARNDGKAANSMVDQARPNEIDDIADFARQQYQGKSDAEIIALFLLRGSEFLSRLLEFDEGLDPLPVNSPIRI